MIATLGTTNDFNASASSSNYCIVGHVRQQSIISLLALNRTRRAQLSLRIIVTLIVHFVLARNDDERGCRAASIHRQNANSVLRSLRVHLSLANSTHYSVQSQCHGRIQLHYMYVSVTRVIVVP
jgi:hypothetical protein